MGKRVVDGWHYIDNAQNESKKYVEASERALSTKDYGEAARNYGEAARVIQEMVDGINSGEVNLLQGMIASANTLKFNREKFLKKAEKLREKEGKKGGGLLERLGLRIVFLLFITSIFFLQSNLTGLAISNLTQPTSNWIGLVLLILSAVGLFLYFKIIYQK